MTFREELALLAREVAELAVTGGSAGLDGAGLAAALRARRDTLVLLGEVLHDVRGVAAGDPGVPDRRRAEPRSVGEPRAHPVAVFARTLAAHPAPYTPQAPTDSARMVGDGAAARSWAAVARHALLAGHEWSVRRAWPTDAEQWSAVADVAAVAQALTVLDHDLLAAAGRLPGVDKALVAGLGAATRSGLRVSAGQAWALAARGPLPGWGQPGQDTELTRMLLVRSAADVAAAQPRIAAQVTTAGDLSPRAVTLLATGQVRVLAAAARVLGGHDADRAARARRLGEQLAGAVRTAHRLASITPDDPRPVAQTRELLAHLAPVAADRPEAASRAYVAAAAAVVDHSPDVVTALARHAHDSFRAGRWLVPTGSQRGLLWRPSKPADPEPAFTAALATAGSHAATARATAAVRTQLGPPGPPPPREVLAGVAAMVREPRPQRPAQSPGPSLGPP